MEISHKEKNFDDFAIFLNGRLIRTPLAANDIEGWVDVLDIAAMSPPLFPEENSDKPWEKKKSSLISKRRYGEVKIVKT